MSAPASPLRWLRAGALAGSSLSLAAGAHLLGGGGADPAFLLLLGAAGLTAAHHWLARERGLVAIVSAVVLAQLVAHAVLGLGHTHAPSSSMVLAHTMAAVMLAVFLRWGEARLHAAARRRYLRWLIGVRLALAGRQVAPVASPRPAWRVPDLGSVWTVRVPAGRGPPAAVCC